MVVFKRKQIVVLSLVLMIVVAGYLQYSYKQSSISTAEKENGKLGEAIYVDSDKGIPEESANNKKGSKEEDKASNDVKASQRAEDYFAQEKLNRQMTRSKDTDALKEITDDQNASKEAKDKAYDQMMKIVANSEKEMKIESLIKKIGFNDALVLFGDDESIDIVVKAPNITSSQIAQITDVASRQGKVSINNIHIKNVF